MAALIYVWVMGVYSRGGGCARGWRIALLGTMALLTSCGDPGDKGNVVTEQAVIVRFDHVSPDWAPFFEWEEKLESAIATAGVGEYDGNELAVDGSDGTLFMYGPDADKLFAVVKPHLESTTLLKKIEVTLRYGEADDVEVRETTVRLGT